jgi:hypothetical protein
MMNGASVAGILVRGAVAGVVGTTAMTALQELVIKLRKHTTVDIDTMGHEETDPWSKAPAPARVGRLIVEGVFGKEVPPERIPLFTNVMHWGFGTTMGPMYAVAERALGGTRILGGPLFGLGVWAQSYATLVPLGLYKPPWRYPAKSIAKDVSYHLVYGTGTAAGYAVLRRLSR